MARRLFISLLAALLAGMLPGLAAAADPPPYPNRMASTGDSITQAFNTCWFPYVDCPASSWSTGTTTTVNSHYLRLRTRNAAINGQSYNRAVSGARMANLAGQMANVNAIGGVQYVTVLMGGNDLCTDTVELMTSTTDFEAQLRAGLGTLRGSGSSALVYLVSVPDVYNLWLIFKDNSSARSAWDSFNVCQSLLANPTSTDPVDEARRQQVAQRNRDYNAIIATVCAQDSNCRTDGGAVFNTRFVPAEVSSRDYFHPSLEGQRRLAEVSWAAGPWGSVAATTHAGDLDGTVARAKKGWQANATVTVHQEAETALAGATVSGRWSSGATGSCTTTSAGTCSIGATFGRNVATATFSVESITAAGRTYAPAGNHDPDGSSTGTAIAFTRP